MNKRKHVGEFVYSTLSFHEGFEVGDTVLTPGNAEGEIMSIVWTRKEGTLITVRYLGGPNGQTPTIASYRHDELVNLTVEL